MLHFDRRREKPWHPEVSSNGKEGLGAKSIRGSFCTTGAPQESLIPPGPIRRPLPNRRVPAGESSPLSPLPGSPRPSLGRPAGPVTKERHGAKYSKRARLWRRRCDRTCDPRGQAPFSAHRQCRTQPDTTLVMRSQPILPFLLSLAVHRNGARKWKITWK